MAWAGITLPSRTAPARARHFTTFLIITILPVVQGARSGGGVTVVDRDPAVG
jgi:hypothetical protein